jgi:diacylglycerol kinase family enzyme
MGDRGLLRQTRSQDALPAAAREFLDAGVEMLAIAGGDGSVHATLNAFLPVYGPTPLPPLLIVPAGTINNLSCEIGMRRSGLTILREALLGEVGRPFQLAQRMLMRVNEGYGFLYGCGFPARLLESYYGAPRQSVGMAFLQVLRAVGCAAWGRGMGKNLFGRVRARITVDGKGWDMEDLLFVLAATISKIGLNFRPCHRAPTSGNAFHLVASVSPLGPLLRRVHRLYLGRPLQLAGCVDALAREVLIELERPLRHMVDGELKEEVRLHRILGDRAISFVVGWGEA